MRGAARRRRRRRAPRPARRQRRAWGACAHRRSAAAWFFRRRWARDTTHRSPSLTCQLMSVSKSLLRVQRRRRPSPALHSWSKTLGHRQRATDNRTPVPAPGAGRRPRQGRRGVTGAQRIRVPIRLIARIAAMTFIVFHCAMPRNDPSRGAAAPLPARRGRGDARRRRPAPAAPAGRSHGGSVDPAAGADQPQLRWQTTRRGDGKRCPRGVDTALSPPPSGMRSGSCSVMDVDSTLIQQEVIELLAALRRQA